jgi:uncharacterized membrane-anchored protein
MGEISPGERFEKILEISLICNIVTGLAVAATVVFGVLTLVSGFSALVIEALWPLILFVIFGLITGLAGGFAAYLFEEYHNR